MTSHRQSMLYNMAGSLILHKKIHTTLPKARAVVPVIDNLITWAKGGSVKGRRLAFGFLKDRTLVSKLFKEIAPVMSGRSGGYTRVLKAGIRRGDGAPMAILELVGTEAIEAPAKSKKAKKKKETSQ